MALGHNIRGDPQLVSRRLPANAAGDGGLCA
jgi:hypothetical protein